MTEDKSYPELLVELRPSIVLQGEIGLFAVCDLKKGQILAPAFRYDERRFISWSESERLEFPTRKGLRKFCASSADGYHAPENLNFIHPLWYCNHSCDPNVAYDVTGNLYAVSEITRDEELCFDYSSINRSKPSSQETRCRCGATNCKGLVDFL